MHRSRSLQNIRIALPGRKSKSVHTTFVHYSTRCEIPPIPPLSKGGTKSAPFRKGGRAGRGGISVRHCANVLWFDLVGHVLQILDFPTRGVTAPADVSNIGDWTLGVEAAFLTKHGSDLGKLH